MQIGRGKSHRCPQYIFLLDKKSESENKINIKLMQMIVNCCT